MTEPHNTDPEDVERMVEQFREQLDRGVGWEMNEFGRTPLLSEEQVDALIQAFFDGRLAEDGELPTDEEMMAVVRQVELWLSGAILADLMFKGKIMVDLRDDELFFTSRELPEEPQ